MADALSLALSAALSLSPAHTAIAREPVEGVPGAVLLRGALSVAEAACLAAVVLSAHEHRKSRVALDTAGEAPRRDSQHHVPLAASSANLASLCTRLRAHLAPTADGGACLEAGRELSTHLRCYAYAPGEESKPHFDRSATEHAARAEGGALLRSSAYSLLLYLSDGYQGGATTFFLPEPGRQLSRRGATPCCERASLHVAGKVHGRAGDVLIFPHGSVTSLLHEGSVVTSGCKLLIRTDVMYSPSGAGAQRAPTPAEPVVEAAGGAAADLEAALLHALSEVCPEHAERGRGCVRVLAQRGAADLQSTAAAAVFFAGALQQGRACGAAAADATVAVQSRQGLERLVTRAQLAQLLLDAMPTRVELFDAPRVADGGSGAIIAVSAHLRDSMAAAGKVACARCGRFVLRRGGGMEWHLKTAHGLQAHAEAAAAAAAAATAIIPRAAASSADLSRAQRNPADAARLVAAGLVKALPPGLEACRSGDLASLRRLVGEGWVPRADESCDEHGSGPLLWAAGGGHLEACVFLVSHCGVDPGCAADSRRARRGYSGRTALHWAARNGHVPVLRWLLTECGVARDARTADGTSALCWAAWQGHLEAVSFLARAGCDAQGANSYGCTAAHWAAQGGSLPVCIYLHGSLGVAFDTVNAQGQGCLHKAAQRGHGHVCDWLLNELRLLAPGSPAGRPHCAGNACEGARPSDLARCGGHETLARRLEAAEAAWLAAA